jgi:isopentenyl-diphosphate delta-isomerase
MPKKASPRITSSRKQQHVALTLKRDVGFVTKKSGLEEVEFIHNALPELDLADIDPSTSFLGHRLSLPLMISCMTGGYADALTINRHLAEVCQGAQIAMGVGSQRQALENSRYHHTFSVVREAAPGIPIVGNIGAAEVARLKNADAVRRLVDLVGADAFAVHLNPLQEFLQPEGDPRFKGVLAGIAMLVKELSVPVIVKEIGAGISGAVANRLYAVGVRYIDVAGAGGTSWAGVEALRSRSRAFAEQFWDWGIPTSEALQQVATLRTSGCPFTIIASGGIVGGLDVAKCIALGADLVASARPMLQALHAGGPRGLATLIEDWGKTLRGAMFCTGSPTLDALRRVQVIKREPK